ncbi:hypothetical protein Scani_18310 [Streptomyces caniferus]|uniref:Uncharacterized protein n=1 Tax=Streptomyces caniferus TaxID=285557 RepID=A0A640S282_9ACTN|nr:hypothetical protein Scani_18310 [Streptomyces caniferus]
MSGKREGKGVGEPGVWVEVTARLDVSRPVLVMRLLELDAAGALTTAHARAGSPQVSHLYGAGWSRAAGTGLAWTGLRGCDAQDRVVRR